MKNQYYLFVRLASTIKGSKLLVFGLSKATRSSFSRIELLLAKVLGKFSFSRVELLTCSALSRKSKDALNEIDN